MKCFFPFLFMIVLSGNTLCGQNDSQDQTAKTEASEVTSIFLEVRYLDKPTLLEKERIQDALNKLRAREVRNISLTDGINTITYSFSTESGNVIIESSKNSHSSNSKENDVETTELPFHAVDEVPIFPGCEDLISEEERKKCTIEKIQEFVQVEFDPEIRNKITFPGIYKTYLKFRVNPEGVVQVLSINAPHSTISQELKHVLGKLPKMLPGRNSNMIVPVSYSFPFILNVEQ